MLFDSLVPFGSALPYRLVDGASDYRVFCVSNACLSALTGLISDNLDQCTPEAEELLTTEVLSLTASLCLEEITDRLDAILAAVKALDICCTMGQGNPGLDETPADIERGIGDPPVGEDWSEYDAILCQSLQLQIDLSLDALDAFTDGLGALGAMGLNALALYFTPLLPPVSLLLALLAALSTILEDELYDQWEGELNLYAQDAICAGYNAYTPASAKVAIDAAIDAKVTPSPNKLLHKLLWSQAQVNRIFRGELEGYDVYDPDYCEVCELPPLDEWHFDGGLEGWFFVEGRSGSELTYNAGITHTSDGTGCAQLYLGPYWYGQWHCRVQTSTWIEVVADQYVSVAHSESGDIKETILQIYFDDETEQLTVLGNPLPYPSWRESVVDINPVHIGKHIVALRLSWQGNDDLVYFDDIAIYTD
jgi:hypothetical protein